MSDEHKGRRLLPDPKVCERYSVTSMTLYRWDSNPALNFPKPIRINRRKYRDQAELEAWERTLATKRFPAATAAVSSEAA